jgi:hypothetical protein
LEAITRKIVIILGLGLLATAIMAGYQIGVRELANIELRDDMQDLASQLGTRIGYSVLASDDELRNAVVRKAQNHGIALMPEHVTVEHIGSGYTSTVYIAAEYTASIDLPGLSFNLHFAPATGKKVLMWRSSGAFIFAR